MPRALQSASLSFGLVNIPVKLYTATHSKSVSFHLLHAQRWVTYPRTDGVSIGRQASRSQGARQGI